MINLSQAFIIASSYKYPETSGLQWFFPSISTEPSGSLEFARNSVTSFVKYGASSDFAVGSGPFTIEWFQWKQPDYEFSRIFSIGTFPEAKIAVSIENAYIYFWMNGQDILNVSISEFPDYIQSWKHVAITRDNSNLISIYFDGQRVASTTSSESVTNIETPLVIGNEDVVTSGSQFRGYLADFHWVTGESLYSGETLQIPTSPIQSTLSSKLLLNANSLQTKFTDSSPSNRVPSEVSSVTWSSYDPY